MKAKRPGQRQTRPDPWLCRACGRGRVHVVLGGDPWIAVVCQQCKAWRTPRMVSRIGLGRTARIANLLLEKLLLW